MGLKIFFNFLLTFYLQTLLRRSVSARVIHSIAGIRKLSRPNITRHSSVQISPMRAGTWSFVVSHCSVKEATNSAVIENSIPAVEKGSTAPSRFPMMLNMQSIAMASAIVVTGVATT